MQTSPVSPSHTDSAESFSSGTLQRFTIFWTLILYVGLALSVYSCYVDRPVLFRSWDGVQLFALITAFRSMYHVLYLRPMRYWPVPFGYALLYTAGQTLLTMVVVTL